MIAVFDGEDVVSGVQSPFVVWRQEEIVHMGTGSGNESWYSHSLGGGSPQKIPEVVFVVGNITFFLCVGYV